MHNGVNGIALAGLIILLAAPAVQADRLLIDTVQETWQASPDAPRTGQTMDQVKARHGDPQQTVAPVGEPPITRWVYNDYTVYFEHDRVLHAVMQR